MKNALVVYTISRTPEQESALNTVIYSLKKHKINFKKANRDKLNKNLFKNKDFVIAVGGDGTFLRAAHFVDGQLMLGVNSDVKNKEGFFMKSNKGNFEGILKKIVNGNIKIKKLPRLEAYMNDKKIGVLALNEFFIGAVKSYHAARYTIKVGPKKEMQKSSGILVTTPAGSYAWAKSCRGKAMPLDSKNFQFVVREPYENKVFSDYRLKRGILDRNKKIEITSKMLDGIIVADSVGKEIRFPYKSKLKIQLSNSYIKSLTF